VHRFEPIVIAATLAVIPVLVIESEAKSSRWKDFATAANWLIWAVFAAELDFILIVAPRKAAALRAHWLDAVIVVMTAPAFGAFLSSLRLLRLARLLRLLRLGALVTRLVQRERAVGRKTVFRIAALVTLFIVVIAGATESAINHDEFNTTWDGIWWALVTVTTVGYGDLAPTSVQGQVIGIFVMLFGIGFLSVLTATVASHFVEVDKSDETKEMLAALQRIETELADVRQQLDRASG
jgi:voltage-gated potassium channel